MGLRSHSAQNFQSRQIHQRQIESSFIILRNMSEMMKLAQNPNIERCYMCCGYDHNYTECPNEKAIPYEEYLELERLWEEEETKKSGGRNSPKKNMWSEESLEDIIELPPDHEGILLDDVPFPEKYLEEEIKKEPLEEIFEDNVESKENAREIIVDNIEVETLVKEEFNEEVFEVFNHLEEDKSGTLKPNKKGDNSDILDSMYTDRYFDHNSFVSNPIELIQNPLESQQNSLQSLSFENLEIQMEEGSKLQEQWTIIESLDSFNIDQCFDHNSQLRAPIEAIQVSPESPQDDLDVSCFEDFEKRSYECARFQCKQRDYAEQGRLDSATFSIHNFYHSDPNLFIQSLLERAQKDIQTSWHTIFQIPKFSGPKVKMKLELSRFQGVDNQYSSSKGLAKHLAFREAHMHEDKLISRHHTFHLLDLRTNLFRRGV